MYDSILERLSIPNAYERHADDYTTSLVDSPDITDRVLLPNETGVVVVPCFQPVWPEDRAPLFKHSSVSSSSKGFTSIRTVLEQAETHLNPVDSDLFVYGIRFGEHQLTSNTTDRFLSDIQHLEVYRDRILADSEPATVSRGYSHAAAASALWPTEAGWLYIQGTLLDHEHPSWTVGLLLTDDPWDYSSIRTFYQSITDCPPGRDSFWPLRAVTTTSPSTASPVPFSEPVGTGFTGVSGDPFQFRLAPNPLYERTATVYDPESSLAQSNPGRRLAAPLFELPMLLYRSKNAGWTESEYAVDRLIAVSPPSHKTLFVTAMLERHPG